MTMITLVNIHLQSLWLVVFAEEFTAHQWLIALVQGGSETSPPVEEDILGSGGF